MNCRNCGNRMQGGYLKSRTDITWTSDVLSGQKIDDKNQDNLYEFPKSLHQIHAFRCLICKKIEFDLNQIAKKNDIFCPKCGNSLDPSSTFCNFCGEEIEKAIKGVEKATNESQFICLNCNNPIESEDIVCPNCGIELDQFANDILNTCVECGYSDPSLEDLAECPKCGALLPI